MKGQLSCSFSYFRIPLPWHMLSPPTFPLCLDCPHLCSKSRVSSYSGIQLAFLLLLEAFLTFPLSSKLLKYWILYMLALLFEYLCGVFSLQP